MSDSPSSANSESEPVAPPDAPSDEQDEQLFSRLDAYLDALHRGSDEAELEALRSQAAEASDPLQAGNMVDWLDLLDDLAPPQQLVRISEGLVGSPVPESPTVRWPADGPDPTSVSADGAPLLPAEFGKYTLLSELGRGGMGVVFQARQKDLDRLVAVKMILSSNLAGPDQVRRLYAEARAAGSLSHKHIVGIHEVGQIHGQHYFAMDYVAGRSLAQAAREAPLEMDDAVRLVAQVAKAVDYLHASGIVHRDLKPSNILINEQGEPLVTDFGLAKVFSSDSDLTKTGAIAGTPSYMAPEQAAGRSKDVGPACDVYSLGTILYELLVGRPPFREETPLDTLVQVLEAEPLPPRAINPDIPAELEHICLHCLEKGAEQRYQTAAALADDLEHYLKGEAVEARPAGIWHRLARWSRRQPALASRLTALAVCALIVQIKYQAWPTSDQWRYHWGVMTVIGIWAAASVAFQWLLDQPRWSKLARYAWAASDAILLTAALVIARSELGPLLVGYPLLIAASGLWFIERLVWFMTAVCMAAFGLLAILAWPLEYPHHSLIYLASLCLLGLVVAYQVRRMRLLSRFYGQQPG